MGIYLGDKEISGLKSITAIQAALANKADIDLANATGVHIVTAYVNGSSWYIIYSNGLCEQGGKVDLAASTYTDIVFLQTYKDINYSVFQTHYYGGTGGQAESYALPIDDSSFRLGNSCGNSQTFCWRAIGYIS